MTQRRGSLVFGIAAGLAIAFWSYHWITGPVDRTAREREEQVVIDARKLLQSRLALADLEIVDPLQPRRQVGKVFVYPAAGGWEVSGFYRRGPGDRWHAYLVRLSDDRRLLKLKVNDSATAVAEIARRDPVVENSR